MGHVMGKVGLWIFNSNKVTHAGFSLFQYRFTLIFSESFPFPLLHLGSPPPAVAGRLNLVVK